MQNAKFNQNNLNQNIIVQKSFALAVRIVKLYKFLIQEKKEYVLAKQILRSGTSIGANVREAVAAYSKADFTAKMSIAQKEASETEYWIQLLFETGYLTKSAYQSLFQDINEVNKILAKILITAQNKK